MSTNLPNEVLKDLELNPSFIPCVCLVDDRQSFLGWAIKSHESGNYNHAMTMISPNYVASQNPGGYKISKIDGYKSKRFYLKFWQPLKVTDYQLIKWREVIAQGVSAPWWQRRYDFLGIFGQLVNVPKIHSPWGKFCSERVRDELVSVFECCKDMKKQPSPADCNEYFKTHKEWFVKGTYNED
jgi:hypothetical protein